MPGIVERQYRWWKEHHPEWDRLSLQVGRGTLRHFDRTVQAFYKRCKDPSKKAGFPRFKPRHRWKSIEIVNADRAMVKAPGERKNHSEKWWRLTVKGVPQIRFESIAAGMNHQAQTMASSAVAKATRVAYTP